MTGMSQFILLKPTTGLHFAKATNAIIAVSLQKSKKAHESFLGEYRGKVSRLARGSRRL